MKQKKLLRGFALLCCICLLLGEFSPLSMVQTASAVTQAEIDALEKEADELAKEKKKVENELAAVQRDKATTLKRKSLLDQQIAGMRMQFLCSAS